MKVKVVEATPASFAKFGGVFKTPKDAPTAEAAEFTYWSNVASYVIQGESEIGWCTVYRRTPRTVTGIERHVRTPELLIPVDGPFILPVLKDGDDESKLEAFRVEVGEAVVIADGVWHGACLPVGRDRSSYFVIFRKGTPQEDVSKRTIPAVHLDE